MKTQSHLPLAELLVGSRLPEDRWKKLFMAVFQGRLSVSESRTLLLLTSKGGEESHQLRGCLRAIRRLEPPKHVLLPFLGDLCGTGGDGQGTFNISTVSAFVVAAAGGFVAKHGNRAVSSKVGSSDLMEALGVRIDIPFSRMVTALRKCRLGYFHAPLCHPTFSKIQPLRRELRIRTVFNLLGPLVNPLELRFQLIGVSNPEWLESLSAGLSVLGRERAALVRSRDGLDEFSTRERNDIFYWDGRRMKNMNLNPSEFGFGKARTNAYAGGDLSTNRQIALGILEDRFRGPRQEIVLLNSGFMLWLMGISPTVSQGIEKSRWVLRTGRARDVLEGLRKITHQKTARP